MNLVRLGRLGTLLWRRRLEHRQQQSKDACPSGGVPTTTHVEYANQGSGIRPTGMAHRSHHLMMQLPKLDKSASRWRGRNNCTSDDVVAEQGACYWLTDAIDVYGGSDEGDDETGGGG